MKRFFFLLLPSALFALFLGNPEEPQAVDSGFFISQDSAFGMKLGYQGDFVWNRKLRTLKASIEKFEILMNQGVLTLNFLDRIDFYGSAGSFNASFRRRARSDSKAHEYATRGIWTAGGGIKILLMQWKNTVLGVDGKYQYAAPKLDWITVNGSPFFENSQLRYREWQVGAALSHTVDIFTPYIGGVYSNVHASLDRLKRGGVRHSYFKMISQDRFGLAVGCSLTSGRIFDLTLEARMFDEQAFTAAGNVKF